MPGAVAVIVPAGRSRGGKYQYRRYTFSRLDEDSNLLARGLWQLGVRPGTRLALLVRPSYEFVALVFALFKAGAVSILIDPGMGRKNLLSCLDQVRPEGFVAIPVVQAVRTLLGRRFSAAKFNVTVGRRWFWRGPTFAELLDLGRRIGDAPDAASCRPEDPAAIIFTSGSTGAPKGVLYRHGNFCAQVEQIREQHAIPAGGIDLACFPLFGLFNSAMGVTTVIPDMDASRPASVDPARLVAAIQDCGITQSFASPAVWKVMGRYCEQHQIQLPTLRQIFSSGAPVAPEVLARMKAWIHPAGKVHTPYGATEALPVATIEAGEVLAETAARWRAGHGTCVGRRYSEIEWRVIPIVEGPIASLADVDEVPLGEVGELIVRAPQVTHEYFENAPATARAKIDDPGGRWHRMGDVGYLDDQDRFWFCGRMSQRVVTETGTLFTDPCEGIFNTHPDVERAALVGVGPPGSATPVIVIEPVRVKNPRCLTDPRGLRAELRALALRHPATAAIEDFLFYPDFPVDVRHNAKIFREQLAEWAGEQLAQQVITRSDRL